MQMRMRARTLIKCADGLLYALRMIRDQSIPMEDEEINQLDHAFRLTHACILYLILDALEDREKAIKLVKIFDELLDGEIVSYTIPLAIFVDLLDRKHGIRRKYPEDERERLENTFQETMTEDILNEIVAAQELIKNYNRACVEKREQERENIMFQ